MMRGARLSTLIAAATMTACGGSPDESQQAEVEQPATGASLVANLVAVDQCADGSYSGPNIKEFIAEEVTTWVVLTELDDQSVQLVGDAPTGVSVISGTGRADLETAVDAPFRANMVHLMMPGLAQALPLIGQVDIVFGLGRVSARDALPLVMVAIVIDQESSELAFLGQCAQLLTRAWTKAADGHPADLLRTAVGKSGVELSNTLGVSEPPATSRLTPVATNPIVQPAVASPTDSAQRLVKLRYELDPGGTNVVCLRSGEVWGDCVSTMVNPQDLGAIVVGVSDTQSPIEVWLLNSTAGLADEMELLVTFNAGTADDISVVDLTRLDLPSVVLSAKVGRDAPLLDAASVVSKCSAALSHSTATTNPGRGGPPCSP